MWNGLARRWLVAGCLSCSGALGLSAGLAAQITSANASSPSGTTNVAQVRTVRGQVIDALTGSAIARALVNLNARQMLTDSRGRFEFEQFGDSNANVLATRPGYSSSADGGMPVQQRRVSDLDQPVLVKLYPDAVVSGVVSGSDGLPLPQVQVALKRFTPLAPAQRWTNAGFAMTNSRGEYRMVTPGGRYRLGVRYSMRLRETGLAVSPVSFPEAAANSAAGFFVLSSGEERRVDLTAHTGETYPVSLRIDQADNRNTPEGGRGGVRFSVTARNGESFQPGFANAGSPGEYKVELPSGSYSVHVHSDNRDQALDGTATVIVPSHAVAGIVIHLAPATSLPVEVEVQAVSASSAVSGGLAGITSAVTIPDLRQLNLSLRPDSSDSADEYSSALQLHQRDDKTFDFRVPAGRYRLQGSSFSPWYVVSASYGTADLLRDEIVIGPGSAGQTIRLMVSNQRGQVRGHVSLPAAAEGAWVYLIPQQPTLAMPPPVAASADGSFLAWLPVGSYEAIALQHPVQEDLSEPGAASRLSAGAKPVNVRPDTDSPLDLQLEHVQEASR